jgi:hypothetical protein
LAIGEVSERTYWPVAGQCHRCRASL